jgi:GWxTD domain-containing protein
MGWKVYSQPLTGKNLREWYNPEGEVSFSMQMIRSGSGLEVFYKLETTQSVSKYSLNWERRDSYTQRDGTAIDTVDSLTSSSDNQKQGIFHFNLPEKPWLLIATILNNETQQTWVYFKQIETNYPVSGWIEQDNQRIAKKFINVDQNFTVKSRDNKVFYVSYFNEDFPPAYPPFADKAEKSDRFMFHDSTFKISPGETLSFKKQGLYLFQKDTNAAEGFAVRAVSKTFPKFSSIEDLKKPLIYICTQDEYMEIEKAKGEKAKFDKVILDITKDKDRASQFMRSYYHRVEQANIYFSSYKEGWKTDRGMIYMIFGLPDEISVNDGNETWYYKTTRARFTFVKSGSVYDPENYILLRDERFQSTWFSTIDLWRKSRF